MANADIERRQEASKRQMDALWRKAQSKYDSACGQQRLSWGREFSVASPQHGGSTTSNAARGQSDYGSYEHTIHRSSTRVRTREEKRIFDRTEWSQETQWNTDHAANLSFDLEVSNKGTDVCRGITAILVNVYLGDSKDIIYSGDIVSDADTSTIDTITNLFPGTAFRIENPLEIPLTLEELRRFDLGESIHIVIERIEYGDDQLFYENAYAGGVYFQVDDGVDDDDEDLKPFLIPTWGSETYMQVLNRVTDVLNLNYEERLAGTLALHSVDVPVYDTQHRLAGTSRKPNADNASWIIFTQNDEPMDFDRMPAIPERTVLFRYVKDSDRDGFSDTEERRIGTDPADSADFPAPDLKAGYVSADGGDGKTYTSLVIENVGNYAATGVEARMYSPNGSFDVERNFMGGGGIIKPNEKVVIGPRYMGPDLAGWTGSATPAIGGIYQGADDVTYVFGVETAGTVGAGGTALTVTWGTDNEKTLSLGAGYSAPSLLDVDGGLQIGFTSGHVKEGEVFTVTADALADAFVSDFAAWAAIADDYSEPAWAGTNMIGLWAFEETPVPGMTDSGFSLVTSMYGHGDGLYTTAGHGTVQIDPAFADNTLTVECILKLTTTAGSQCLFQQPDTRSGTWRGRQITIIDGVVSFAWAATTGEGMSGAGPSLAADTWYYLGVSCDATSLNYVLKNIGTQEVSSGTIGPLPGAATDTVVTEAHIGIEYHGGLAQFQTGTRFQGVIDNLRLSDLFFTTAQLEEHSFHVLGMAAPETGSSGTAIVLSYNSPRGNHRLQLGTELPSSDVSPEACVATRGTSLTVGTLSLLAPEVENEIHARVVNGGGEIAYGRLHFELIDSELAENNVVWSTTITERLPAGSSYLNPTLRPTTAGLSAGKVYYLLTTLTDKVATGGEETIGGNIIDQCMIALAVDDGTPPGRAPVAHSVVETSGDAVDWGEVVVKKVTVSNTGDGTLEFYIPLDPGTDASHAAVSTSLSGDMARVAPGQSVTFYVHVETGKLPTGGRDSLAFDILTNDSTNATIPVSITFTSTDQGTPAGASHNLLVEEVEGAPWTRRVTLLETIDAGATITFAHGIADEDGADPSIIHPVLMTYTGGTYLQGEVLDDHSTLKQVDGDATTTQFDTRGAHTAGDSFAIEYGKALETFGRSGALDFSLEVNSDCKIDRVSMLASGKGWNVLVYDDFEGEAGPLDADKWAVSLDDDQNNARLDGNGHMRIQAKDWSDWLIVTALRGAVDSDVFFWADLATKGPGHNHVIFYADDTNVLEMNVDTAAGVHSAEQVDLSDGLAIHARGLASVVDYYFQDIGWMSQGGGFAGAPAEIEFRVDDEYGARLVRSFPFQEAITGLTGQIERYRSAFTGSPGTPVNVPLAIQFSGTETGILETGAYSHDYLIIWGARVQTVREEPDLCVTGVGIAQGRAVAEIQGGTPAILTATIENHGDATASNFVVAWYDGDPTAGGEYRASTFVTVELPPVGDSGETTPVTVSADWTVTGAAGEHTIYAVVDPYNDIAESDETNNTTHTTDVTDLLISYWDEIVVDCGDETEGSSERDIAYSGETGYGYESGVAFTWGDGVDDTDLETTRYAYNGEAVYRFDNVSPAYAYNLDMSFHRPDGVPIQFQVYADDRLLKAFVADTEGGATEEKFTIGLNDGTHAGSAFATAYLPSGVLGDGSVRIRIVTVGGKAASVSHIQLTRGGRIFIDCGDAETDLAYSAERGHGFTTVAPSAASYGQDAGTGESTDSLRFSPLGHVGYKFSALDSAKSYVVRPTLTGLPGTYHRFALNGTLVGNAVELAHIPTTHNVLMDSSFIGGTDSSVVFGVVLTDADGNPVAGDSSVVDIELNEFTAAAQIRRDSDNDRMPDWWELRYANAERRMPNAELRAAGGLDPGRDDADVDLDGDGFTNYEEYRANTSPVDGASAVAITRLERGEDGNEVTWNATRFTRYAVLRRDDLADDWEPVAEIVPVRDGEIVFADVAGDPQAEMPAPLFYRVRVLSRSGVSRSGTEVETATVSSHAWDMPAQRGTGGSYLVCVPFLGITRGNSTIASVFEAGDSVVMESVSPCFADIADGVLALVRDGQAAGAWFAVKEALNANDVVLDQTPGHCAGDWQLLASGDRFTIHPTFRLSDLFGDDGSVLTAGAIDQVADKVHMYHDGVFRTFWLSDGTILGAGWVAPEERLFVYEDAILYPGTAVFVDRCQYAQAATAWASGEVLSRPLLKPLFPGYTFASVEYNESRVDPDGVPSMRLGSMGLAGPLTAGPIDALSDWLYVWDGPAGMYRSHWLSDGSVLEAGWLKGVEKADEDELTPGKGAVILRRSGDGIVNWLDGVPER